MPAYARCDTCNKPVAVAPGCIVTKTGYVHEGCYKPECAWCGEQANEEQGSLSTTHPGDGYWYTDGDEYYHDDCFAAFADSVERRQ